jgi:transposase
MESMPAPATPVTVGVDTHLETHVAAVVDQTGRLLDTQAFPASTRGYVALVTWAERFGPVGRVGIEGTGTFGAGLARFVRAYGLQVVEVARAAPTLVALPGVGIETAGQLLVTAGDNPQRLRSEAAFAHLCGVSPIPASSGRTDRHRLM